MEYEKIILELLNRIMALEERVSILENTDSSKEATESQGLSGSKKYRFLSDFLYDSNQSRIKLSYENIESILNFKLPDSASTHRTFWANTTSHSIALSWLSVGYVVAEVNLEEQYIIFEKNREKSIMGKKTATTEEQYLSARKNYNMIELYLKLKEYIFATLENTETAATADYISWGVSGGHQFANLYIQKKKIRILTRSPIRKCCIGENVPDTHLWTLNYKIDISTDNKLDEVRNVIMDSYNQVSII